MTKIILTLTVRRLLWRLKLRRVGKCMFRQLFVTFLITETRKRKIHQKIAIWRKLNLSTVGNLTVAITFLISQLGYLLSMLECPKELLKEIQNDIDSFILRSRS